jgi:hypothetical protein
MSRLSGLKPSLKPSLHDALLLFRSLLFTPPAQVEMQAAFVLSCSLLLRRYTALDIDRSRFCSGIARQWKEKLLLSCSVLFCSGVLRQWT